MYGGGWAGGREERGRQGRVNEEGEEVGLWLWEEEKGLACREVERGRRGCCGVAVNERRRGAGVHAGLGSSVAD